MKRVEGKKAIAQQAGCLALVTIVAIAKVAGRARGQIIPDGTLPLQSIVTPAGNQLRIEGGTRAGGNLFHSFEEFSVPTGGEALFNNSADVRNILSRVTGSKISNIDGLISAKGTANIFLINPRGIVFGPNARLNVGGSFVGSTADSIVFGEGSTFSATTPEKPLLTIDIPIGLNFRENDSTIAVQGSGHSLFFDLQNLSFSRLGVPVGLEVKPGQTLALVGGKVEMLGGSAIAPGGSIELASVTDGMVSWQGTTGGFEFDYAGVENFGDLHLSQAALVDASGSEEGINVVGRRVQIREGSAIVSNGSDRFNGGLSVRASESVEVVGAKTDGNFLASSLLTLVPAGIAADGDNLYISTGRLRVADGGQIVTSTLGSGSAGNLRVEATEVEVTGTTPNGLVGSGLRSEVLPTGTGNGGKLTVSTSRLRVANGGQVSTLTVGAGRAGELEVRGTDIEAIGTLPDGKTPSGLLASSVGAGDAGSIRVETDRLRVADGAEISVGSIVAGAAGNMTVIADTLDIDGGSMTAATVKDGGEVTISANRLVLSNGGQITTNTLGSGSAGNLRVQGTEIELIGSTSNGLLASGLRSEVSPQSTGNGGSLTVAASSLRVVDGAQISTTSFGAGNAGNLDVRATNIDLIGTLSNGENPSGLSTGTFSTGNGGSLQVEASSLRVADGAVIAATTFGRGNAGMIWVQASQIELIGGGQFPSGLYASSLLIETTNAGTLVGTGDAGTLNIAASSLRVADGAEISVSSMVAGAAGNAIVVADEIHLDRGNISAEKVEKMGANIILTAKDIQLRRGSAITTNATGIATGGNITINTDTLAALEDSDITANAVEGNGGQIAIATQGIFLSSDSQITASSELGIDGVVEISRPETDPGRGLIIFEEDVADPADLIAQDFCQQSKNSSFVIRGRGGLPPNPNQYLDSNNVRVSWIDPVPQTATSDRPLSSTPLTPDPGAIVPARGWVMLPDGRVQLVAYQTPNTRSRDDLPKSRSCATMN